MIYVKTMKMIMKMENMMILKIFGKIYQKKEKNIILINKMRNYQNIIQIFYLYCYNINLKFKKNIQKINYMIKFKILLKKLNLKQQNIKIFNLSLILTILINMKNILNNQKNNHIQFLFQKVLLIQ